MGPGEFLLSISIVALAALYAQRAHYVFKSAKAQAKNLTELNGELSAKMKEFEDYKKRVDALTVRAGFKL